MNKGRTRQEKRRKRKDEVRRAKGERETYGDDLGVAVGLAGVVDEASDGAPPGGVDDGVLVDAEEIGRANALLLVLALTIISQALANDFTDVLDHHLVLGG